MEEEARRLIAEETYEHRKPEDKEEKRFLRIVAHFDDLLFKESLLGEPIREGEKSATVPLKFKLQGEGVFTALFFHIVSVAFYFSFLLIAFWVKYDPSSRTLDRLLFTSPAYSFLAAFISAAVLSAVPVFFVKRYVVYPEGYLFVRVKNFLYGYWFGILGVAFLITVKIIVTAVTGESFAGKLLSLLYQVVSLHLREFVLGTTALAFALFLAGALLLFGTRKDYLNAVGMLFAVAGATLLVFVVLLVKYGATVQNAQWLLYYLFQFVLSAFSDKCELAAVVLPLLTYFYFRKRVSDLKKMMYGMPYSPVKSS